MAEEELVAKLKQGNTDSVRLVYDNYKAEGMSFLAKLGYSGLDVEDVFQEAVISLMTNVKTGKFRSDSKVKTYFMSILKFKAYGSSRAKNKLKLTSIEDQDFAELDNDKSNYDDSQILKIRKALAIADEKCRALLKGYYFDNEDLKTLSEKLNLSYSFVRQKKIRCLKSLRKVYETS